jgi:hypothetical protein
MKTNIKNLLVCSVCLVNSIGWGFTLYNSNMEGFDPQTDIAVPPAADYDLSPNGDFSDCVNAAQDHWAWPVGGGQLTITYFYDPSFDTLFTGPNAASNEAAIKAQIQQAMTQWETASSVGYGKYDSYARASSLNLDVTTINDGEPQQKTVAPFMDVRSATLHELGHILGLAHCDQGVTAGRNYAYFDSNGNRGTGSVGSGTLEVYGSTPNTLDLGQNYYIDSIFGVVGYTEPGIEGQEVMSQYSAEGPYTGTPVFGREPGEINHILSWDELDGYFDIYQKNQLVFQVAQNEGTAALVIYGGPIIDPVTGQPDTSAVCQGLPLGTPTISGTPAIGIQQAQIIYNNASQTQIGYATTGFNFDITANTGWEIYSVVLNVVGTENTTLAGPTFDNFAWYQGNANYQFEPGVPFSIGDVDLKDEIGVRWSHSPSPIPSKTLLHVGVTPDVWDWSNFKLTATLFDNRVPVPDQLPLSVTPVHWYHSPAVVGGFADTVSPDGRVTGACLTSIASTNSVGVSGLAITGPTTTNSTAVFNLQVADVTGMGLTLSNLNSIELAQLQQSNQMISVDSFGSNTLNSGEPFVVILQGSTNYLPANIYTNRHYAMALSLSNLVNREVFAVVTSQDGHSVVNNYSLLNAPSTVATVQSNLNLTPPKIVSAQNLPSGAFQLSFTSANNPPLFYILSTTNLALPLADWTLRGKATNTAPGQFQYTDTKNTANQRYYRIRWMLSQAP